MLEEFVLEDPGEGIHEVEIREVLVSAGDQVNEGDNVLVVESDKAVVELPSPFSGKIEDIRFGVGETATVGDILLTVESDADADDTEDQGKEDQGKEDQDKGEHDNGGDGKKERAEAGSEGAQKTQATERSSGESVQDRNGSDRNGKSEGVQDQGTPDDSHGRQDAADSGSGNGSSAQGTTSTKTKAAPAARRLAAERGLKLADIEATGSHGQVTREDVERADGDGATPRRKRPPKRKDDPRTASDGGEDRSPNRYGQEERQPLRSLRRATAKRMAKAWSEIPHVMHQDEADITDLEALRQRLQPEAEEIGGKLAPTVFVLKALAAALRKHPRFNASLDMENEEIVLKRYCNINVALDSDRGLIAPVLRDVDRMSILELSVALKEMVDRVRGGEATKDDLSGGTFTLTNVGSLGGTAFSPIINYPQVAILGMARAHLAQRVSGDISDPQVQTRYVQPLVVAFDHRIVDGADAARFLNDIIAMLADPEQFLLRLS